MHVCAWMWLDGRINVISLWGYSASSRSYSSSIVPSCADKCCITFRKSLFDGQEGDRSTQLFLYCFIRNLCHYSNSTGKKNINPTFQTFQDLKRLTNNLLTGALLYVLNIGVVCKSASFTLLSKQAAFPYLEQEGQKCEVSHSCSIATKISADHMKSCRLYSRLGWENYSPALSTLALNLN